MSSDVKVLGHEVYRILCRTYIEYANKLYYSGNLSLAADQLNAAEKVNSEKLKTNEEFAEEIFILRKLIDVCSTGKNDASEILLSELTGTFSEMLIKNDGTVYLYCLSKLSGISGTAYSMPHERAKELKDELSVLLLHVKSKLLRTHIDAKLDMISAEYLDAKAKLLTVLTPDVPPPLMYDLYGDLEFCCKCCGDFENAYKYSILRLELIKSIT